VDGEKGGGEGPDPFPDLRHRARSIRRYSFGLTLQNKNAVLQIAKDAGKRKGSPHLDLEAAVGKVSLFMDRHPCR
jgi:hypothetical protein